MQLLTLKKQCRQRRDQNANTQAVAYSALTSDQMSLKQSVAGIMTLNLKVSEKHIYTTIM